MRVIVLIVCAMLTLNCHETLGLMDSVHSAVKQALLQELLDTVGDGTRITKQNITHFIQQNHGIWNKNDDINSCINNVSGKVEVDQQCIRQLCLSPEDVYEVAGLDDGAGEEQLTMLTTVLVHLSQNRSCMDQSYDVSGSLHGNQTHHEPPSAAAAWGFGILCTTVINLASLAGVIALPFIHGNMYKRMLVYMVGLAVGTLAGSSLFFLIPEALELTDQELNEHSFIWKCLTVIIGIYMFFIIERVLKMITTYREKKKHMSKTRRGRIHRDSAMSYSSFHKSKEIPDYKKTSDIDAGLPCCNCQSSEASMEGGSLSDDQEEQDDGVLQGNGRMIGGEKQDAISTATKKPLVPRHHHHGQVAPVAWMIIFGDGLHNFIDGVSIGAAFTESILAGVSVSVAILCEELPHELGDFAVLLNAGMKIKKAVLYNFLSATMCYLGLVVGIFLGENTSTHTWVFAFAGGMFLYISLVDMMPEMNSAAEDEETRKAMSPTAIFITQNIGLVSGFALMLIMAIYGGALEEAIVGGSS